MPCPVLDRCPQSKLGIWHRVGSPKYLWDEWLSIVGIAAKYTEFLRDLEWVPGGWCGNCTFHSLTAVTMVTVTPSSFIASKEHFHTLSYSVSQWLFEIRIIILTLGIRKPKFRVKKYIAQRHTASKWAGLPRVPTVSGVEQWMIQSGRDRTSWGEQCYFPYILGESWFLGGKHSLCQSFTVCFLTHSFQKKKKGKKNSIVRKVWKMP